MTLAACGLLVSAACPAPVRDTAPVRDPAPVRETDSSASKPAPSTAPVGPPPIPVGADAYDIERWPYLRIATRTYLRSTFDRTGGNEAADASHFLYQLAPDRNVALDVRGPGMLWFVRHNRWHGSPWHYEVDGRHHVVRETSTADPLHPAPGSIWEPRDAFPNPLTWTWAQTNGADLSWVPIAFEEWLRIAYERTHYGTGYFIYSTVAPGAPVWRPLRSWDARPPDRAAVALLGRAGEDLAPPGSVRTEATPTSAAQSVVNLDGPAVVRALELDVPAARAVAFSRARLRIFWDGRPAPSVDAPAALFFGAGTLYNRDGKEWLVKALPVNIRFAAGRVRLASYFPMPFHRTARIEVTSPEPLTDVRWSVRTVPFAGPPNHVGWFHATYRDHPAPERGKDLVLLDTRGVEGATEWAGHLVGTSWIFSHNAQHGGLEGDPRFFLDESRSPQAQGTGTEEWGGGGDYWGGRTMTLPLVGHPVGAYDPADARDQQDLIESAYRFLLADVFPFGRRAVIGLEHGGLNESAEHYETVTYWYGTPSPALVRTDELDVGDPASERAHRYVSAGAKRVSITSRYEWGPDTLDGREVFPEHAQDGRTTTGTSEFTLRIRPDNHGVLLRRTLDLGYPNQRADVEVADEGSVRFRPAGVWFTAGGNTVVYSNPLGELDPAQTIVQTSNRRFRDDEFLLPVTLTRGRSAIRVRVRFTPVDAPLHPAAGHPEQAWSELHYAAESFVLPSVR